MTNTPDLSRLLLLFLLSVGSLLASDTSSRPPVTSDPLPGHDGHPNATEANPTPATSLRSSNGTGSPRSQGNETSEKRTITTGTERSATERGPEGTESASGGREYTRPPATNRMTRALTASTGHGNGSDQVNATTNGVQTTPGGAFGPKITSPPVAHTTTTTTTTRVTVTAKPARSPDTENRDGEEHTCSTDAPTQEGLVGRCLIVITVLAGIATVFVVSTVVLATKLAGSRYRHRARLLQETEMVCISAFLNDTDHPLPKPRHPKSNGALIPGGEDEDGDDLTLNSFLPETDITA